MFALANGFVVFDALPALDAARMATEGMARVLEMFPAAKGEK